MSAPVDWTNPCARAAALSSAYYTLISGGQETFIHTRTYDSEQRVRFEAAKVDVLKRELEQAQAECDALTDPARRPRRFCFTGG